MKYCQAKRTNRPRQKAFVLGDSENNLPFAREEAALVAEHFGTPAHLGRQATKTLLKEKLTNEKETLDIIHFACHGYFDSYQPLKSGIALAKNGDGDANLTAEEIFGLELHADLVVISACESGVNERKPGDELIGLTRALIYAGTPSVLVSLWQVNDLSTLILMENFYQELSNGSNKAQALQQAQLKLMNMTYLKVSDYVSNRLENLNAAGQNDRASLFEQLAYSSLLATENYNPRREEKEWCPFSHPAAWAPFILVGDWK
jgi:CHAT domain-containing protein